MEVTLSALERTYSGKTDDELLLLHGRGTLTEVAYEALEAELARREAAVPPRPHGDVETRAALESYRRMTLSAHWRGQASLASAYWLVGTLGFWLMFGAVILVGRFVPVLTPLAVAALLAFLVFAWVSIWRCWKNTGWRFWGHVARTYVIIYVLVVGAVIVVFLFEADVFTAPQQRSLLG